MNNNSLSNEKQQIGEQIQQWILLDNKLKEIQEQQRLLRTQKQELNGQICSYMKRTNNNKIKINDEFLKVCDKKEYAPLTFQYVESTLETICSKPEVVKKIMATLKDNRTIKLSTDIRRV